MRFDIKTFFKPAYGCAASLLIAANASVVEANSLQSPLVSQHDAPSYQEDDNDMLPFWLFLGGVAIMLALKNSGGSSGGAGASNTSNTDNGGSTDTGEGGVDTGGGDTGGGNGGGTICIFCGGGDGEGGNDNDFDDGPL